MSPRRAVAREWRQKPSLISMEMRPPFPGGPPSPHFPLSSMILSRWFVPRTKAPPVLHAFAQAAETYRLSSRTRHGRRFAWSIAREPRPSGCGCGQKKGTSASPGDRVESAIAAATHGRQARDGPRDFSGIDTVVQRLAAVDDVGQKLRGPKRIAAREEGRHDDWLR